MKTFVTAASLAIGASAAVMPRTSSSGKCCFELTASGGVSGTLSQLSDGQNRVGGNAPNGAATYCIDNGQITDGSGRGCILTPPTTQFQCDSGATPTGGFSVSSNGYLEHNGDTTFYACPAKEGSYNIYTTPVKNQPKCVKIELSTGGKCEAQQTSTCSTATMTMTETEMCTPSTMYKTEYDTTTMWHYSTEMETMTYTEMCTPSTEYKTVYKTNEEYETKTMPVTVYETKVQQETVTAESPTTVYETKVQQETVTAESPTTVYKTEYKTEYNTKTMEETVYATKTEVNTDTVTAAESTPMASSTCPAELNGEWQYPHLIVPISSEHPDMSYGTQYNGMCNSTTSSMYNFDIPNSYEGMTCELVFMWPMKNQLETSSFSWNGQGGVMMSHCDSVAKQSDTWNSAPKGSEMGQWMMKPGNSYSMWSGACPAGTTQSYEMSAMGGMNMEYFQDYNPCPLGLYMKAH